MTQENTFGSMITMARRRMGWNQQELADAFYDKFTDSVSRVTVNRWENGLQLPSVYRLQYIVTLLGLSEEEADTLYRATAQVPPRVHNIPLPQNPFFTGREMQLKRLGEYLQESGSTAPTLPVIISGLGGIGKTQLALQYAYDSYQKKVYRAVYWVNAADKLTLQASYDDLTHLLELPEINERKVDRRIQAVKRWLGNHNGWLLILDNADDLQLARSFLPIKYNGHILLTTRSQIVGTIARQIVIEAMEPEVGLLFLLKRAGMVQHEADIATLTADVLDAATELVTWLGGFPLALDQAGAYVEETGVSFADYLQLYQDMRCFLLDRRGSDGSEYGDHPDSVVATIELSVMKACERQPLAADILYFCSFLRPSDIPEELLQQEDGLQIDTKAFNEAIVALRRYSLIKRNAHDKTLSMHRLVQAILIDTMSPDLKMQWKLRVIRALSVALPEVEFKETNKTDRLLFQAMECSMGIGVEPELISMPETSQLHHKVAGYFLEALNESVRTNPQLWSWMRTETNATESSQS